MVVLGDERDIFNILIRIKHKKILRFSLGCLLNTPATVPQVSNWEPSTLGMTAAIEKQTYKHTNIQTHKHTYMYVHTSVNYSQCIGSCAVCPLLNIWGLRPGSYALFPTP